MATMTSEVPPTTTRQRLLLAALSRLASDGPDALQARKVAADIGASTMAVYTHFGGMQQLVEAMASAGFEQFAAGFAAVATSDDCVADLFSLAIRYRDFALDNPQLYRLMFGLTAPSGNRLPGQNLIAEPARPTDRPEALAAFSYLTDAVTRVIGSGRASDGDALSASLQLWSLLHGYVLLEIAGYFGADGAGVEYVLVPMALNMAVGFGDSIEAARMSVRAALAAREATQTAPQ